MAAYIEVNVADGFSILPSIVTREYAFGTRRLLTMICTFPPFRLVGENGKIGQSLVESHLKNP